MADDPGNSLIRAVRNGNVQTAKELIDTFGLSHSIAWSNGYNLLRYALQQKQPEVTKLLLNSGSKINSKSECATTPLHFAAKNGYTEIVAMLLERQANVNAMNLSGETPLHFAVHRDSLEIVKLLMKRGAGVHLKSIHGITPLYLAVQNGNLAIVEELLSHGAGINSCTQSLRQSFMLCMKAKVPLLHLAAEMGQDKIVKLLLERGANVDTRDAYDKTILLVAVEKGDYATVEQILLFRPDIQSEANRNSFYAAINRVNAQTKNGTTALHFAAEGGYVKIVELLLKHKADVNSLAEYCTTPLHSAAKRDNKAIVKILLDSGANVNARQKYGMTPLHIASNNGHEEVVKLLVQRGAGLDTEDNDKSTPLHHATVNNYWNVSQTLLELGANVDVKDRSGRTALHVAARDGSFISVETLLKHGADINVTCINSMTPMDYATHGVLEYNNRHRCLDHNFDEDDWDEFGDDYERGRRFRCQQVAIALQHRIVMMKALGLFVSKKNLRTVDLQFQHRHVLEECQMEVAKMKIKKIGDSGVSFHDILTKGINQLAVYARNQSIVAAFEAEDYVCEFPPYCGIIARRFKQGQKRGSLLSSSLKSLTALSGFFLPDLAAIEILNYLGNADLENLIGAEPNAECEN